MTSSEIPPLVIPCSFLTHILARARVAGIVSLRGGARVAVRVKRTRVSLLLTSMVS